MANEKQTEKQTVKPIDVKSAPEATSVPQTAAAVESSAPLFGEPNFSRPDRTIKTKDGKSQMVAQVEFVMGGLLHVETGIWCRSTVDRERGVESLEFSVSLPRGVRPIKGDAESVDAINAWKENTLLGFDEWEGKQTEQQQKAATQTARLVKVRPLTDSKTTPAPQTVPVK